MGFFDWMKRKGALEAPELELPQTHLAFVLLPEMQNPAPEAVIAAYSKYQIDGESRLLPVDREDDDNESESSDVAMFELEGIGTAFAAFVDVPVPDGEAEESFQFSLSSFNDDAEFPPHQAHMIVTLMGVPGEFAPVQALSTFTSFIAALMDASQAVGVYWGNAGATHTADFVLGIASEREITPRLMLWNGVSRGPEPNGRISMLSRGMNQLGLPDLFLTSAQEEAGERLGWMFDLLSHIAQRGEPIPAGDTVGISADERLQTRYTESPAGDGSVVLTIDG